MRKNMGRADCHENTMVLSPSVYAVHKKVAAHFSKLLSENFPEQKTVTYYARELNISPKHLTEILFDVTGKSAKTIILDHIIHEAKKLLRESEMSVQEISNWLGYEDFSCFTKLFKRKEGVTPLAYRKSFSRQIL